MEAGGDPMCDFIPHTRGNQMESLNIKNSFDVLESEKDGVMLEPVKGGATLEPGKGGVVTEPGKGGEKEMVRLKECAVVLTRSPSVALNRTASEERMDVMDSSDTGSLMTVASLPMEGTKSTEGELSSKFFRGRLRAGSKRRCLRTSSDSDSGSEIMQGSSPSSQAKGARRGRGRPPTTGQYVGLAKAQEYLNKVKREELELRAMEEVSDLARRVLPRRGAQAALPAAEEAKTTHELSKVIDDAMEVVAQIAARSKNLKGGYVRDLKNVVATVRSATVNIANCTSSEDNMKLIEENARLRAELNDVRKELQEVRAEVRSISERPAALPVNSPQLLGNQDVLDQLMLMIRNAIDEKIDGIRDRLLPEKR
ncbi:uncharacterized protein LOC128202027, partial [Galleria mellonella]|uniref:Uncharacterized protein LOC128202027 n=1 Tax=Galleria mellonella TaxID=7137 RepID=A0ABM3MZL3_GALME